MSHLNIEIKARCSDPERVRKVLQARDAVFKGVDHQVDTYFRCAKGRLKFREGNIEYSLIHYDRQDEAGPKDSLVTLYHPERNSALKEILSNSLDILVIVRKRREIYFIDNVKFHIDIVDTLGSFVEIEAIDVTGAIGKDALKIQCDEFMRLFGIQPEDLLTSSYSDMLLAAGR